MYSTVTGESWWWYTIRNGLSDLKNLEEFLFFFFKGWLAVPTRHDALCQNGNLWETTCDCMHRMPCCIYVYRQNFCFVEDTVIWQNHDFPLQRESYHVWEKVREVAERVHVYVCEQALSPYRWSITLQPLQFVIYASPSISCKMKCFQLSLSVYLDVSGQLPFNPLFWFMSF